MNKEEIRKIVRKLSIAFPYYFNKLDEKETKVLIDTYEDSFKDISYELVDKAVSSMIPKTRFMPSVAEIIEKCEEIKRSPKWIGKEIDREPLDDEDIEFAKEFYSEFCETKEEYEEKMRMVYASSNRAT